MKPVDIFFKKLGGINQRTIWSKLIQLYPSQYSSMISYKFTRLQISIYPLSLAQSKLMETVDPSPNIQRCSSLILFARVVLPDPLGPIINTAFINCKYYQWCYITNIIQMQILETYVLRKQNASLKLKYAMAVLKLNCFTHKVKNISFRDEFLTQKTIPNNPSSHSIQLQNKQLYLRYVEEVLTAKEQQLIQLQQHLNHRRIKLDQKQGQSKITNPSTLNHYAELITKKIGFLKQTASKLASCKNQSTITKELEEFQNGLKIIQESCQKNHEKFCSQFIRQFEQLNSQRQQIGAMKSKLHELQSYQKYLNQLQTILEQKEYQIIVKERELQELSHAFYQSNGNTLSLKNGQFNTYKEADQSIRKRTRIFEPRTSSQELMIVHNPNHKQSSKILQETSTNDYTKQTQKQSKQNQQLFLQKEVSPQETVNTVSWSSQTPFQNDVGQAFSRLLCDKIKLKFIKLWVKHSQRAGKGGALHRKCMNLYLWRLNTIYDQQAKSKIQKLICWPRKIEKMGVIPQFDYKELSLKKRRYLQLFFNYERKTFQRTKILTHLNSILKNKNRRERTAVYIYFQKYKNNSNLMNLMNIFQGRTAQSFVIQKPSNISETQKKGSQSKVQSRVLVCSASQNRANISQHSKNKLGSSKIAPSATTNSKTRLIGKQQAAIDIPKLKQYIKNQEQTEVKLATECAHTEASFKILNVLSLYLYRQRTRFIVNSLRISQTSKLNSLEKAISSCEFKWQLFMAKARLALTNNSNKIAHLQQLVGFMDCK